MVYSLRAYPEKEPLEPPHPPPQTNAQNFRGVKVIQDTYKWTIGERENWTYADVLTFSLFLALHLTWGGKRTVLNSAPLLSNSLARPCSYLCIFKELRYTRDFLLSE